MKFDSGLKERMCRRALEPQGLTVKRFWIDDAGLGHAETTDAKGRVFVFNEKPKGELQR